MIEKFLAMLGINPEMFQAQMERVTAEAKAVVQHFDKRTLELREGQQHIALALNTVIENQRLIFAIVSEMRGDPVAHVNGNSVLEHDENFAADEKETVQ